MRENKNPDNQKTQTGLRLPGDVYREIVKEAKEYGVPVNSYMTMLIGLGRKVVLQSVSQCDHAPVHSPQ